MDNLRYRKVAVGGLSKQALLGRLANAGVEMNEAARRLFDSPEFTTNPDPEILTMVELSVADLGFQDGATMAAIHASAIARGYEWAPLELGPHLRLQYLDQPEGSLEQPRTEHRAPPGSVTIASAPLSADDEFPKGFYLRRIEGKLWLRGYRSGPDHLWAPEDRLGYVVGGRKGTK